MWEKAGDLWLVRDLGVASARAHFGNVSPPSSPSTRLDQLSRTQHDLVMQAGLLTAPFTPADLLHPATDLPDGVADVKRLRELTLISPAADNSELIVHPWIGHALRARLPDDQWVERHRRAADMRLHRINIGRARFDDITEYIAHLAGFRNYDKAIAAAFQAADMAGGAVAVSAMLAEIAPLIPISHPGYLALADRECQSLAAVGLVSATLDRRYALLAVAEDWAAADPDNAENQGSVSIILERLGDLAVALGDTGTAEQHFRAKLGIDMCLVADDPDNPKYQRDLSISHEKLGDLAVAAGDTRTADQHHRAALAIAERLAAADPGNAGYQRDLSIIHNKLGNLAVTLGDTPTADQHYRADLAIAERLAAADSANADYQRDVGQPREAREPGGHGRGHPHRRPAPPCRPHHP